MRKTGTPVTSRLACGLGLLLGIFVLSGCSAFRLPNDNFEDIDVPVIDTGLVQTEEHFIEKVGAWLNNDLLVINAVQEKPPANIRRPWRVVLFNLKTRQISELIKGGFNE